MNFPFDSSVWKRIQDISFLFSYIMSFQYTNQERELMTIKSVMHMWYWVELSLPPNTCDSSWAVAANYLRIARCTHYGGSKLQWTWIRYADWKRFRGCSMQSNRRAQREGWLGQRSAQRSLGNIVWFGCTSASYDVGFDPTRHWDLRDSLRSIPVLWQDTRT